MSSTPPEPTPGDPLEGPAPGDPLAGDAPTEPTQEAPRAAEAGPPPPRRLTRTTSDRVLAGVSGGVAKYFNIDPVLVRLGFVVGLLFGGATGVLYLAAILLVPEEGSEQALAGPAPDRNKWLTGLGLLALVVIGLPVLLGVGFAAGSVLVPLGLLALAGLGVAWAVTGRKPAGREPGELVRLTLLGLGVLLLLFVLAVGAFWGAAAGGDVVIASLVIAAGLGLVASAFTKPARWLILPAFALALPAAFVAAAGITFDGGYGEERYRPSQASEIRDEYKLGVGSLTVDLRDADLPAGDHRVKLDVGMGEAVLLVPDDVCVATTAEMGMGGADVLGAGTGGIDVDLEDRQTAPAGTPRVIVDAHVGLGGIAIAHEDDGFDRRWERFDDSDDSEAENAACA